MIDRIVALLLEESKWLTASMAVALVATAALAAASRGTAMAPRRRVMGLLNLFSGVTVATMAFGHLLAVTLKLALGTLQGSIPVLYFIGIVLIAPAAWLVRHAVMMLASPAYPERATPALNAWLAFTLLALGPHNFPLAVPALLNIGYHLHSRPAVGWAVVGVAVVVQAGLFVGSLVFLASGQSFEQFRGME